MNAPVVILAIGSDAMQPSDLGRELYEAAMRGEVALSHISGCLSAVRDHRPVRVTLDVFYAARRIAIDLAQHAARRPDAALVRSCRAAVAVAEDIAEGAGEADLHAALAQIADLLDGALSLTSD